MPVMTVAYIVAQKEDGVVKREGENGQGVGHGRIYQHKRRNDRQSLTGYTSLDQGEETGRISTQYEESGKP